MFFKTDSELFRSKYSQPLCTNHKGLHCRWPFIHFLLAPPSSGKLPFYFFWCSSPPIFCLCTFCKLTCHFSISRVFNGWSRGITFSIITLNFVHTVFAFFLFCDDLKFSCTFFFSYVYPPFLVPVFFLPDLIFFLLFFPQWNFSSSYIFFRYT